MPTATAKKKPSTKKAASKQPAKKRPAKKTTKKAAGTKTAKKKTAKKKAVKKKTVTKQTRKAGATGATTPEHDKRVAELVFSSFYPHYVSKVVSKGRTEAELHEVLRWLTGYTQKQLEKHIAGTTTVEQFFAKATLNPDADQITGTICGYRIEAIATPLTRHARYMDKLVDELAKGKPMDKILRA
ncbi:MAG: DUF2200 domain-containing protein [Planctomycetota bacterium]